MKRVWQPLQQRGLSGDVNIVFKRHWDDSKNADFDMTDLESTNTS